MSYLDVYHRWVAKTADNMPIAQELREIAQNQSEIEDRFYKDLEFGTGGLRDIMGAGSNRLNIYTVSKATQGYSNYLKTQESEIKVAIAYDSRRYSRLFAETAAGVFAANGIRVYIYPELMPTPALSFAIRDLKCSGGVVITASHNPAEYNGYKVYGPDGCQINTETAKAIQKAIDETDIFDDVKKMSFDKALLQGRVSYIGEEVKRRYLDAVSGESLLPKNIKRDISIVYTPLNGTGICCVPECLKENGFNNIIIPAEQKEPDGNFPTCPYPNPEVREALEVGLSYAEKNGSELLVANDPDCDRMGAAVKTGSGYKLIDGNQMGVLLFDFVCKMRVQNGTMPDRPIAVKTIVTTPMAERIAKYYGVEMVNVLTGFKFIGEQIGLLDDKGEKGRFVFGLEESYGYLSGDYVRDKDGAIASLLVCEMAAWYKSQGKTLVNAMDELCRQFGYYENRQLSFLFKGASGAAEMSAVMGRLRKKPVSEIAGLAVEAVGDYLKLCEVRADGSRIELHTPQSNVLRYFLKGGSEVVVRPSGTEPKLKAYLMASGDTLPEVQNLLKAMYEQINMMVLGQMA